MPTKTETARRRKKSPQTVSAPIQSTSIDLRISKRFSPGRIRLGLVAATVACLLPFINKPFNIDDPLFMWTAKQIVQHPMDPYGFSVVWYQSSHTMSYVTKNPPLAAYYAAIIGQMTDWSERTLHLAFILPAVMAVLATYELARELTTRPLLAALFTLAAPGFLVSATGVMCDISMLALWMLSILAWQKGLLKRGHIYFVLGAILIGACALTKYYGACLIPLLLAYSIFKQRRLGYWAFYLLIPIGLLVAYQMWTETLYDRGLLLDAAEYAQITRSEKSPSLIGGLLVGLSFTGGCMLPVLLIAPWLLSLRWKIVALASAIPGAILIAWDVLGQFTVDTDAHWRIFGTLVIFIAGGVFTLALTLTDLWRRRDAASLLLAAWVFGTFIFAATLNWTVNARSLLPMIPAIAILIARGLDHTNNTRVDVRWGAILSLVVSLVLGLWLAAADMSFAKASRELATLAMQKTRSAGGATFFSGHWGFQYYMQELGARPFDFAHQEMTSNDLLVKPENNTNAFKVEGGQVASSEVIEIDRNCWITPMHRELGAGFYSTLFGPLPYAWGRVPPEKIVIYRFKPQS